MWREDRWITDRTKSKDPVFKRTTPNADVDRLIRNTYKVLLTRGMVGTVLYSTDAETREQLRELVALDTVGGVSPTSGRPVTVSALAQPSSPAADLP